MSNNNLGSILVTGSTGMLGRYVMNLLTPIRRGDVYSPGRKECDLTDPQAVYSFVKERAPAAILHLAAETDVDLCERDPGKAGISNHMATDAIARAASEIGSWLLYVSTSNVFGAEGKLLYNELDTPQPLNYYGRSKLQGEWSIRRRLPDRHLIVRAGWMIGGGLTYDHKFVGKIIKQIRDNVPEIRAVIDRFGSITSASLLARFVVSALETQKSGTFHFCSRGVITRFDIAQAIAQQLSFNGNLIGVPSSLFPLSAPRPLSEGMESIYSSVSGATISDWRQDLSEYLKEFQDAAHS